MEEKKKSVQGKERKNKKDSNISSLPPCYVCGDKSSGLHFGVIVCEACKVFFRRNYARETGYACIKGGSCDINVESRGYCSYCRLQKCFRNGMSKSNSVMGRRSNGLKENIISMSYGENKRSDTVKKPNDLYKGIIKETTQRLLKLHDDFRMITPEVIAKAEQGRAQKKMFQQEILEIGDPLPLEEIKNFYRETGIDLSGMMQEIIPCARECTKKVALTFIRYVRCLKEFMELSLHDRIFALKGSAFLWFLVSSAPMWNAKDRMLSCMFCGFCFNENRFPFVPKEAISDIFFQSIGKFHEQNLTDEETAVFRALVIFDASLVADQELEEPEKISAAQNLFLDCFLYTLAQTREEENVNRTFAKLVEFMTNLRFLMYERQKFIKSIPAHEYPEVKVSRVAAEVFGFPETLIEDLGVELSSLHLD